MGGLGSGRIGGLRAATTSEFLKIDLAWMRREGLLAPGRSGFLSWSRCQTRVAQIRYDISDRGLRLTYKVAPAGREAIAVEELIPFLITQQRFGGYRIWLSCPSCRRRVRTLFGGSHFRCRFCHGLKFMSQYEPAYDRAIERANRIREKLGDTLVSAFECDDLPKRPKGMRWATYRKLVAEYQELQRRWQSGVLERFGPGVLEWR